MHGDLSDFHHLELSTVDSFYCTYYYYIADVNDKDAAKLMASAAKMYGYIHHGLGRYIYFSGF